MPTIKQPVSLSGIIRGQGLEATCLVSALKVTLPGANVSAHARYAIQAVSGWLPEGEYELSVDGHSFALRHQGGNWLSASPF